MRVIPVTSPELAQAWVRMPVSLYKDDPNYIQPLDKDIEQVFDTSKNKKFRKGKAQRWLVEQGGWYLGRIAAFFEEPNLQKKPIAAGGIGFFESVDRPEVARMLFEVAENWLRAAGANAVDGPVNFGDRDRWWGCLVEGFTPPNYGTAYGRPYYGALFEQNGYQIYFKQLTYTRPVEKPLVPEVRERAERVANDPAYRFEHIRLDKMDRVPSDLALIYNKAWGKHQGVPPIPEAQWKIIVKQLKPVIDPYLIWFGYHNDEPVSFLIMLPDLNQIFRHMHGKWGWWQKLKFLWYKKTQPITRIFGLLYGVVPEHQGKGVESAMVTAAGKIVQNNNARPYTDFEMNWIGDFNPKMMKVATLMGGEVNKIHITYRKMLDPSVPFEPMAVIR